MVDSIRLRRAKARSLPTPPPGGPRMLATDLDGTLLDDGGRVSKGNGQALGSLRTAGIPVILATGRTWAATRPILEELRLDTPVVLYNGARVMTPRGEVLYDRRLAFPAALEAVRSAQEAGLLGFVYLSHRIVPLGEAAALAEHLLAEDRPYLAPGGASGLCAEALADPDGSGPIKLLFFGSPAACDRFERAGRPRAALYRTVRSAPDCVEVLAPGTSKATGLRFVMEGMGVRPQELVAVGNAGNDVEMLTLASLSVAVRTAEPAALRRAAYLAPAHTEDAVAAVARHFFPWAFAVPASASRSRPLLQAEHLRRLQRLQLPQAPV